MSRESCSDKETEAGLTSECWTTLHALYPAGELSTLLFVFTMQRAYMIYNADHWETNCLRLCGKIM